MTILFDVHAHLEHPIFKDKLDEVINRAKETGVKIIIANGVDKTSNRKVLELAEKYDIVKPALGIYPIDALSTEEEGSDWNGEKFDPNEEIEFIKNQDIVAIGEVGLDLKHGKDLDKQKVIFLKLLNIAKNKNIPIIIHSRKAEKELLDLLEEQDLTNYKKIVLHCFSGKFSQVKRAIDAGYYFSIPCNIVKGEHFQKLVKEVHISKLLTETDSPYLGPGKDFPNEPKNIIESVKKIAEIKGMVYEDTANNLFMNYQNLF